MIPLLSGILDLPLAGIKIKSKSATPEEAQQPITLQNFAENCIIMKDFGLRGGVCLVPTWIRHSCVTTI